MPTAACSPQLDASIACALLAAGSAERFGGSKLHADLGGIPMWRWAATCAETAGFVTRLMVTNDEQIAAAAGKAGWQVHANPRAAEGLAASIRIAARAAAGRSRLVIALADMPFVDVDHLRRLATARDVAFTRYPDGRDGVPASFPAGAFAALGTIAGDRGAGALPWKKRSSIEPADAESLTDIDTADQLARAQSLALRLCPGAPR